MQMIQAFLLCLFSGLLIIPSDAAPAKQAAKPSSPSKSQPLLKSAPVAKALRKLEQEKIHFIYTDGDFDLVVAMIDTFARENPVHSKDDSVFIAKHLAVIYTANPATRERGKNHMFRLLDLLPSAKIVDMFVSDEIDHIFEKIREEYKVRQQMAGKGTPSQLESNRYASERMTVESDRDTSSSRPAELAKKSRSSHTLFWVAGGTALAVGAGTMVYLMLPDGPDKNYDIPD